MWSFIARSPATAASISSSVMIGSSVLTTAPDHAAICALSDSGIPNISEITSNGSGKARSVTTSPSPRAANPSSISSTNTCTRGRSASIDDGVNALLTSRRRRV